MIEFALLCLYWLVIYTKQVAIIVGSGCMLAYCMAAVLSTLFLAVSSKRY